MRKDAAPELPVKPFLISKGDDGSVRLTLRETRRNSLGYPFVVSRLVEQDFKSTTTARAYAVEEFGAKAEEITLERPASRS